MKSKLLLASLLLLSFIVIPFGIAQSYSLDDFPALFKENGQQFSNLAVQTIQELRTNPQSGIVDPLLAQFRMLSEQDKLLKEIFVLLVKISQQQNSTNAPSRLKVVPETTKPPVTVRPAVPANPSPAVNLVASNARASFVTIDRPNGGPARQAQFIFSIDLAVPQGSKDAYLSKSPSIFVDSSTNVAEGRITTLDSSDQSAGDTANSFIIEEGRKRTFTLSGIMNNEAGVTGVKYFQIKNLYWGDDQSNFQKYNLSGVDNPQINSLRVNVFLDGGATTPPTPVPAPTIISSNPPNGAIDARWNTNNGGLSIIDTWENVVLNLNSSLPNGSSGFSTSDFRVLSSDGTTYGPKGVSNNGNLLSIHVPIGAGNRVRLTHKPSGWNICLGYLPGDVNGNGTVSPADQLDLIDALNGVKSLPLYSTDIDRSGVAAPADILAFTDLLNGGWNGKRLPACPGTTSGSNTDSQSQFAGVLTSLSGALETLQRTLGGR